jgi:hypothetical protein
MKYTKKLIAATVTVTTLIVIFSVTGLIRNTVGAMGSYDSYSTGNRKFKVLQSGTFISVGEETPIRAGDTIDVSFTSRISPTGGATSSIKALYWANIDNSNNTVGVSSGYSVDNDTCLRGRDDGNAGDDVYNCGNVGQSVYSTRDYSSGSPSSDSDHVLNFRLTIKSISTGGRVCLRMHLGAFDGNGMDYAPGANPGGTKSNVAEILSWQATNSGTDYDQPVYSVSEPICWVGVSNTRPQGDIKAHCDYMEVRAYDRDPSRRTQYKLYVRELPNGAYKEIYSGLGVIAPSYESIYPPGLRTMFGDGSKTFRFELKAYDYENGKWWSVAGGSDGTKDIAIPCNGPLPQPVSPELYVDGVSCVVPELWGWAFDGDDPGRSIEVAIYDGPYDGVKPPVWIGATNEYREDVNNAYGIGGVHGFRATLPASVRDGNDHTFHVFAHDNSGAMPNTGPIQITMTGCGYFHLRPTAASPAFIPNDENPSQFCFTTKVDATYDNGWGGPAVGVPTTVYNFTITKNGVNVAGYPQNYPSNRFINQPATQRCTPVVNRTAGDRYCGKLSIDPTDGIVDRNGNILRIDNGLIESPTGCPVIVNQPYVHFIGSDVSAGGGFENAPSCSNPGSIKTYTSTTGFNNGGTAPPVGSGVQIGALSIGPVEGFSSAQLRTSSPTGSTGLTFANTTNVAASGTGKVSLGGNFGGTHCAADYWKTKPTNVTASPASGMLANFASSEIQYYEPAGGTLRINLATTSNIADGADVAIFVKGNVRISNNINFASSSWGTIENIPSFYLIVVPDDTGNGGNIYIDNGVTQLDGVYIAQPNSANQGGGIYTCSNGAARYAYTELLQYCRTQLLVNGAFVAKQVYLDRSFGSMRNSFPGEYLRGSRAGGPPDCGDSGAAPLGDCAAEIFNFGPEIYLSNPSVIQKSGPTTGKYDYLTSLSPVL